MAEEQGHTAPTTEFDAVVVGAGFGGIYMLHKLRNELGLDAVGIDKAGGVGGTWYWNKYPGALSDSESFVYQYSFDRDLYAGHRGPRSTCGNPRSSSTSTASSTAMTCASTSPWRPR